ncbi:hypothetical protein F2Q69_00021618 [Brassica cretica]|uniref:Uncharacterized protein n=1 Tax=Brassica cretica TaxID=69181 RepID=A0A8S9Q7V7_BRACR|nr:hypothetical protein F2Q69_00021618 [Brassica cretica]
MMLPELPLSTNTLFTRQFVTWMFIWGSSCIVPGSKAGTTSMDFPGLFLLGSGFGVLPTVPRIGTSRVLSSDASALLEKRGVEHSFVSGAPG